RPVKPAWWCQLPVCWGHPSHETIGGGGGLQSRKSILLCCWSRRVGVGVNDSNNGNEGRWTGGDDHHHHLDGPILRRRQQPASCLRQRGKSLGVLFSFLHRLSSLFESKSRQGRSVASTVQLTLNGRKYLRA